MTIDDQGNKGLGMNTVSHPSHFNPKIASHSKKKVFGMTDGRVFHGLNLNNGGNGDNGGNEVMGEFSTE